MKSKVNFWEKMAPTYDKAEEKDQDRVLEAIRYMIPYLQKEDTLLDIGCGTGSLHEYLLPYVEGIVGLDFSQGMIAIAKEKAKRKGLQQVTYLKGSLEDHRFDEKSFELASAFYLLHLLDDLPKELDKIYKLLEDQAYFISITPCLGQSSFFKGILALGGKVGLLPQIKFLSPGDLKAQLEAKGFSVLEEHYIDKKQREVLLIGQKIERKG